MRLETDIPESFRSAAESMHAASLRDEIELSEIRPPQKLAPLSHAVGLEISASDSSSSELSYSNAFGRLILLFDPSTQESGHPLMRLVAYIQADMDASVAADPLLPDVSWDWLNESLESTGTHYEDLGVTVTCTNSVRFGDIGGPPQAYQLEMRASWSALDTDLSTHVEAFAQLLALVTGLPPEGTHKIG